MPSKKSKKKSGGKKSSGVSALEQALAWDAAEPAQKVSKPKEENDEPKEEKPAETPDLEEEDVDGPEDDDGGDEKAAKSKVENESNTALQKITDYVEEKQMDENKVRTALLELRQEEDAHREAERKRERELAQVKVDKSDVELIVREMMVSDFVADRKLREANGDLKNALLAMLE